MEDKSILKGYLRLSLIPLASSLLFLSPYLGRAADPQPLNNAKQNFAAETNRVTEAVASTGWTNGPVAAAEAPAVGPGRVVLTTGKTKTAEEIPTLDPQKLRSLARAACAIHHRSDVTLGPVAGVFNLPDIHYTNWYSTKSMREFGIVEGECGLPSIRMIVANRTEPDKNKYGYSALITTEGAILGLTKYELPGPKNTPPVDLTQGMTPEIQAIYTDLLAQIDFWNTALNKTVESQRAEERAKALKQPAVAVASTP